MNSKNITVILPVHDVSGDFDKWFKKAVVSIEQSQVKPGKLMIVCSDKTEVKSYMDKLEQLEGWADIVKTEIVYNNGDTSYCGQINHGIASIESEYFSILEYDEYIPHYDEVDIFLPLVVDTDQEGQFIGFTNEALWAMGFSEETGFLDNTTLLKYQNFQVSGMIMSVDKFNEIGGMKSSMKLTFNYEFLLRASYNDTVIMTIPKVGYKHTNQRDNSLFWDYKNTPGVKLEEDEAKFWIETAKKEYFFTTDRELVYNN